MAALPKLRRGGLALGAAFLAIALGVSLWPRLAAGQPGQTLPPGGPGGPPASGFTPPGVNGSPGTGCMGCPAAACIEGAPAEPKRMTVEQLIAALADVKARKAELEKREKELVEAVKAKLKDQKDRLRQLGVPLDEDNYPMTPCTTGFTFTSGDLTDHH
jgi:hypothetical protein